MKRSTTFEVALKHFVAECAGGSHKIQLPPTLIGGDHGMSTLNDSGAEPIRQKAQLINASARMLVDIESFNLQMQQDIEFRTSLDHAERSRPLDCPALLHFREVNDYFQKKLWKSEAVHKVVDVGG